MNLFEWGEAGMHRFKWYDISIFKISIFVATLIVAKIWPVVLTLPWPVYIIVGLVSYAWVLYRMF